MPSPFGEDSELCRMLRLVAPQFEHRLFLSATPHNGHTRSFTGLLEMLDPVRFTRTSEMTAAMRGRVEDVVVRRLKREINARSVRPGSVGRDASRQGDVPGGAVSAHRGAEGVSREADAREPPPGRRLRDGAPSAGQRRRPSLLHPPSAEGAPPPGGTRASSHSPPRSMPSGQPYASSCRRAEGPAAAREPSRWRSSASGCSPAPPHSPSPGAAQGRASPTRMPKRRPSRSSPRPSAPYVRRPATTGKPSSARPPPRPSWARGSGASPTMWRPRSVVSNTRSRPWDSCWTTPPSRIRRPSWTPASTPSSSGSRACSGTPVPERLRRRPVPECSRRGAASSATTSA